MWAVADRNIIAPWTWIELMIGFKETETSFRWRLSTFVACKIKRARPRYGKSRCPITEIWGMEKRYHLFWNRNAIDVTEYGVKGYGECTHVNICTELRAATNGVKVSRCAKCVELSSCNVAAIASILQTFNNFTILARIIGRSNYGKIKCRFAIKLCVCWFISAILRLW